MNYLTEGIFCLLLEQDQKQNKKLEVQLFLVRLLMSLALAIWLHFLETSVLGLIIGLAIIGVEFIGKKVAIGLSGWFW